MKQCSICREFKPKDDFYNNKSNKIDGLNPYCKKCTIEKSKKYRRENIEKAKNYDKKIYQQKREYYIDKTKKWVVENKDHYKDYSKKYRKENPEYFSNYSKERKLHKKT